MTSTFIHADHRRSEPRPAATIPRSDRASDQGSVLRHNDARSAGKSPFELFVIVKHPAAVFHLNFP